MDSVNVNGYLYIVYELAHEEKDYYNFPKNQFFRKGEILKLFDNTWEIITIREEKSLYLHNANPIIPYEHKHKIGCIYARKKVLYK